MAARNRFYVLIATDGSAAARAALTTAVRYPWPADTSASAVVAKQVRAEYRKSILLAALDRTAELTGRTTARAMSKRWPAADAHSTARADLLIVGARGVSGVKHLVLGSVAEGALNRSPGEALN